MDQIMAKPQERQKEQGWAMAMEDIAIMWLEGKVAGGMPEAA